MFPFCPFPFASLSIRTFRSLSAFQSVSNQLVGLVGGSHGRSEFTVLHAWGAVDFRLGRRAANPAALLVFYLIGSPLRCCVRVLLFQMRFILLLIARV
ncbi:unnamed protein product [Prunus armeniaca]